MSTTYTVIPENTKTLFLRNLESRFIIEDLIQERDIPSFRKYTVPEILTLLNEYVEDSKNLTNTRMLSIYIEDCVRGRYFNEVSILDNQR